MNISIIILFHFSEMWMQGYKAKKNVIFIMINSKIRLILIFKKMKRLIIDKLQNVFNKIEKR